MSTLLPEDEALAVTSHQLLLCMAALRALAANPHIYPQEVIYERAEQARKILEMSAEGRRLLETAGPLP